jgi:hypothetical protein
MKKSDKVVIGQVLSEGDLLAQKQADFNENYIVKANDVLYGLLADIMAFGDMVLTSPHKQGILSQMRTVLSKEHKIKTQKNSPDVLIIVKFVVRTNRKNAHVYARVLDLAYKSDVMPNELPDFIREHGGIDRIRESNVNLEASAKKKVKDEWGLKFIKALLNVKADAPIAQFTIPQEWRSRVHDSMGAGSFLYPICVNSLGGYKVVGVVPMDFDFEKQILERVYIDLGSKGSYSDADKAQIARAKEIISPAYQLKLQEERDRAAEEHRAKKQAAQQLALAA